MRQLLALLIAAPLWGQLAITTTDPAAVAGGTLNLAASGGTAPYTWSLSSGSVGSINPSTGQYTAPATVTVNHQAAGCQVFPSASIFSTKISNLPVHTSSAAWLGQLAGTERWTLAPNYGLNIVTNSTPTYNLVTLYTPTADGIYPIADFPLLKRQGGYYSHPQSGLDRHIANVNKDTCEFTEMYNTYSADLGFTCPNGPCTANSAARYDGKLFKFQVGSGVDAAGLPLQPVTLKLADFNDGVIKHPMRFTLPNNRINPSYIWPATANALAGSGLMPYGAWVRLKSSYNISGFSAKAQVVLQAWKDYGLYMADGGLTLEVTTDGDISQDKDVVAAIDEIRTVGPQVSQFEVVDPSSMMVAANSAAVKHDNGYETPVNFAHACVTDAAMNTACKYIALQGVTIGTTYTAMTFQAGASAVQLDSWVHGSANQSVTWAIIGTAIGTLTAGGSYTPPATVASPTVTMFEATAAADSNAKVRVYVVVWPEGVIRVDVGRYTDYVGSDGTWFKEHGFDGGQGSRTNEATNWTGIPTDATLYHTQRYIYSNDLSYRWWLSPGNYKITLKWGIWSSLTSHVYQWQNGVIPARNWLMGIDTNGTVVKARYDVGLAQGILNTDHDLEIPCWVKAGDNGLCHLVLRQIADKQTQNPSTKGFCWAGNTDKRDLSISGVSQLIGASNTSPIVLSFTPGYVHGVTKYEYMHVTGVGGNTAANGFWRVASTTASTITLEGTTGNGAYTSGGMASEIPNGGDPSGDSAACAPGVNAIKVEPDTGGARITIDGDTTDITFSLTRQLGCVGWFIESTCTWQKISGPGTIDANGLYTAPSTPPVGGSQLVTIRATHTVNTGLTADISFNFAFGTIAVNRPVDSVFRGQTSQFSATINTVPYTAVTWVDSGQGSINSSGLYSAPGSVSPDEEITITATSTDDPSKTGSSWIDIIQLRPTIYMNASSYGYTNNRFVDGAGITWINDEVSITDTPPADLPVTYQAGTENQDINFTTTVIHGPGCDANDATFRKQVYLSTRQDFYDRLPYWGYTFSVPNGRYRVRLKFLAPNSNTSLYRENIAIQGTTVWSDFNPVVAAGGQYYCTDLETTAVVTNGSLEIRLTPVGAAGSTTTLISGVVLEDLGPVAGQVRTSGGVAIGGAARLQ